MARLGPFGAGREVVVAVSGGADSLALALLLSRWGRPFAAIVDHGLRPEAAEEAAVTAVRLRALGVPSRIFRAGLRPGPATAERAREARYRLLLECCRQTGRPDLLLAHHAGDAAETVRLRQDGRSGVAGLAGMSALDIRPEARLLRPLLAIDPARLRATLREAGLAWVEDPSNTDPRTGRGRLRATMGAGDRAAALACGRDAAMARAAQEQDDARELAAVAIHPEGFAVVPGPIGATALSALIWTIAGRRYPPPVAALAAGLATRSVAGVLIRLAGRLGPGTLILREPASVAPPVPAVDGARWDGRFRLTGHPPNGTTLGALGADAARFRRRSHLPAAILAGLPALRRGDEVLCVPLLHFPDAETSLRLRISFWPGRPVAPMPFARPAF